MRPVSTFNTLPHSANIPDKIRHKTIVRQIWLLTALRLSVIVTTLIISGQ